MKFNFYSLMLLSICLLLPNLSQAQKLRDKGITIKYVKLPSKVVPLEYKTFSVEAGGEVLQISGVSQKGFTDDFRMQGFKKVNGYGGSAGHLHMVVDLGYLSQGKEELKTKTTKAKDKDGNEVTVKKYYYSVPFSGSFNAKIFDPNGKILASTSENYSRSFSTAELSNQGLLIKSKNKRINDLTRDAAQDIRQDAYSNANGILQSFDYKKTSMREQIYLIKKHSSEAQWTKHFENVKKQFENAGYYPNTDNVKESLEPSIAYYKRMGEKSPRGDKKLERIYKAANLNLATIYYYLEDMASSIEYAEKVLDGLGKDRKSESMVNDAKRILAKMDAVGVNTIYYKRDLSNALAPGQIADMEADNEKMMEDANANDASIVLNGEKIYGKMLLDKEAEDLIFGQGGNIKFVVKENGELKEMELTNSDISSFEVADRKFMKTRFASMAKGQGEAGIEILEMVYSSKRISLFKYYPSSGALSDEKPEYAFQKRGEEFPISLESTQFLLWKKGLAKYFGDCKDLAEMASEGGIEKTKDDLIKAARVYAELCVEVIKP